MRTTVTDAEIRQYREQGFVVLRGVLDAGEVRDLAQAVDEACDELGDRKLAGSDWKDGDGYYEGVFLQRLNLWKLSPVVRRYMLGAELGGIVERLSGARQRVWHDQTLQKKPWANPTSWHLDNPYWSFSSHDAISAWIALDDATLENGCLHYLPGSHRLAEHGRNVGIGPHMDELFKAYPEMSRIDPVSAPMRAGDCGFHNGMTAHGAGANMTPRWRRAMTCAYMPAGSVFNGIQNILSRERAAALKPGDSLDDDAENPLVGEAPAPAAR